MSAYNVAAANRPLHPIHAVILAFSVPLFAGALLSDIAYIRSYQVQWANFSSWLIAGSLAFGTVSLLWALVDLFRGDATSRKRLVLHLMVVAVMWVLGFINALVHAKDAWATMPEGLYLSAITSLLALIAVWMGHSRVRYGEVA